MRKSAQISFESGPAPLRVHLAGFAIVASILAIVAIWSGIYTWELETRGIRTTGTVVANEGGDDASYPVFEFSDTQGRVHTVSAAVGGGDHQVGSSIPVIYPKDRPLRARVDDRYHLYATTAITGGLCVVFVIGIVILLQFRTVIEGTFETKLGTLRALRSGPNGKVTWSERSSLPLLTWVRRIFGIGAMLMVAAAFWTAWQKYEFARSAETTQGTVVGLARTGRSYEVQVLFSDAGNTSYLVVLPDRSNDYLVGDAISLVYPLGQPRDVRRRSLSVYIDLPVYLMTLAVVLLLVWISTRIQLAEIGRARRSDTQENS
jgi:hypothetical protein